MKCIICNDPNATQIASDLEGYVEKTRFTVFHCGKCNTNFIPRGEIDTRLYDIIYSNKDLPVYSEYYKYATTIKDEKDPLKFLSDTASTYFPVYSHLKDRAPIDILEIGCGYGYLTYALNKRGHNATGIDISEKAIAFAKKNFGDFFMQQDVNKLSANKKYDVIIATELIEHLEQPAKFLKKCIELLKKDGQLIITTPNKEFSREAAVWETDLPPIHTVWLSKKSFEHIAMDFRLDAKFVDFSGYCELDESRLSMYLWFKMPKTTPSPTLTDKGDIKAVIDTRSPIKKLARRFLTEVTLIRKISNLLPLKSESPTLGVILQKKQS